MNVSDIADAAIQILVHAQSLDSKITALKLIDALLGKGPSKISSWKKPPTNVCQKHQIEHVVANLLIDGHLKEDFHFTPYYFKISNEQSLWYLLFLLFPIKK